MKPEEREATHEDLREILTDFWLGAVRDEKAEFQERIKASELLAKFILGEGTSPVKRKGARRPTTEEVLRLAAQLEKGNGDKGSRH